MRCSSSDGARVPVVRGVRARVTFLLAVVALAAAGCRTTQTTVTYVPNSERPRLTLAEGGELLARFLRLECPRPTPEGRTDSLLTRVQVAEDGLVREAELLGTTGNTTTDGIIGAIAAQLTLQDATPRPAAGPATIIARFRCGTDYRAELALGGS